MLNVPITSSLFKSSPATKEVQELDGIKVGEMWYAESNSGLKEIMLVLRIVIAYNGLNRSIPNWQTEYIHYMDEYGKVDKLDVMMFRFWFRKYEL